MSIIVGRLTFPLVLHALQRDMGWMREDVWSAFKSKANIAAVLQVCCYTEALARFRDGTVVEASGDNGKPFKDFVNDYFHRLREEAFKLGTFFICTNRATGSTKEVDCYEAFYRLWRHGFVHEYLGKSRCLLTRTSDDGERPILSIKTNRRSQLDVNTGTYPKRLNVHLDHLVDDFLDALDYFEKDLTTTAVGSDLRRNCVARYRFVVR